MNQYDLYIDHYFKDHSYNILLYPVSYQFLVTDSFPISYNFVIGIKNYQLILKYLGFEQRDALLFGRLEQFEKVKKNIDNLIDYIFVKNDKRLYEMLVLQVDNDFDKYINVELFNTSRWLNKSKESILSAINIVDKTKSAEIWHKFIETLSVVVNELILSDQKLAAPQKSNYLNLFSNIATTDCNSKNAKVISNLPLFTKEKLATNFNIFKLIKPSNELILNENFYVIRYSNALVHLFSDLSLNRFRINEITYNDFMWGERGLKDLLLIDKVYSNDLNRVIFGDLFELNNAFIVRNNELILPSRLIVTDKSWNNIAIQSVLVTVGKTIKDVTQETIVILVDKNIKNIVREVILPFLCKNIRVATQQTILPRLNKIIEKGMLKTITDTVLTKTIKDITQNTLLPEFDKLVKDITQEIILPTLQKISRGLIKSDIFRLIKTEKDSKFNDNILFALEKQLRDIGLDDILIKLDKQLHDIVKDTILVLVNKDLKDIIINYDVDTVDKQIKDIIINEIMYLLDKQNPNIDIVYSGTIDKQNPNIDIVYSGTIDKQNPNIDIVYSGTIDKQNPNIDIVYSGISDKQNPNIDIVNLRALDKGILDIDIFDSDWLSKTIKNIIIEQTSWLLDKNIFEIILNEAKDLQLYFNKYIFVSDKYELDSLIRDLVNFDLIPVYIDKKVPLWKEGLISLIASTKNLTLFDTQVYNKIKYTDVIEPIYLDGKVKEIVSSVLLYPFIKQRYFELWESVLIDKYAKEVSSSILRELDKYNKELIKFIPKWADKIKEFQLDESLIIDEKIKEVDYFKSFFLDECIIYRIYVHHIVDAEKQDKLIYIPKPFIYTNFYRRWYFMPSDGPYDRIILPYDYPYEIKPYNGVFEHPLPNGKDKALEEIDVDINIIANVIDFCHELWIANSFLYSRYTPEQALKHFVNTLFDWLDKYVPDIIEKLPEYYEDYGLYPNPDTVRQDYWRIYKLIRWYAEAFILNVPPEDKNRLLGNRYVKYLIQDLIKYFNDHHGVYGPPGEKIFDKVKGIRHKWLTKEQNKLV